MQQHYRLSIYSTLNALNVNIIHLIIIHICNNIHIIIFTFNNLYYTKKHSKTELVIILNIDNMHECNDNPNIS